LTAIQRHIRQNATIAVRKTSSSEAWITRPPMKPWASSADSPAPIAYEAMRYAWTNTPMTMIDANTRLSQVATRFVIGRP
jgi:hypothetical protein